MHVEVDLSHERPFYAEISTQPTTRVQRVHVLVVEVGRETATLILDDSQLIEIRDVLSRHIEEQQHRQNGKAAAGSAATAGVGTYRDGTPLPF